MNNKKLSAGSAITLAILALTLSSLTPTLAAAQTESVLYSFGATYTDADAPLAGLIFDAAGNLYGTTEIGGAHIYGTVFELSPKAGGGWTERVLHSFGNGIDGQYPLSALVMDASGNLYGTTSLGGAHGYGTVFELSPQTGGRWSEKILHSFNNDGKDGFSPNAGVILDASGNLYGTTVDGGAHAVGTAFELTSSTNGWSEKLLHSFSGPDGANLFAGLVFDKNGNLYGAACYGGTYNNGTVFRLTPEAGGQWAGKVLHNFGSNDAQCPMASLIIDSSGGVIGTAVGGGGAANYGVVFAVSPATSNTWREIVLYNFSQNSSGAGGIIPVSGVIMDAAGNIYGTTDYGGTSNTTCNGGSCGTVFELTPASGGGYNEVVLNAFDYTDGANPVGGLIFDAAGNLYGTTAGGGALHYGTVFEITP